MQIQKAEFDIEQERRRARRETVSIILTVVGIMIAAFAAGHFIR